MTGISTGRHMRCSSAPIEAHALIALVDATPARALPGVIAVLTGADVEEAQVKPHAATYPPPGRNPNGAPNARFWPGIAFVSSASR